MILVTGATGHLGNAAIQSLLKRGVPAREITALVRDENKAAHLKDKGIQIRIGNYNDYNSLKKALQGVDKLLQISSNEVGDSLGQQKNVISAAKENGVGHIVYTGMEIQDYEETAIPFVTQVHKATADYIKETGIAYTIMNDSLYADSIGKFSGERFLESGIFFPAGDGRLPWIPRTEVGEAAAAILTTSGHKNKSYAITSNTANSFEEIAGMLSEITGKEVKYLKPDLETYVDALGKAGLPKEVIGFLGGFSTAIKNGEFNTLQSDFEKLVGRKPMALKEFLKITYGK
jgi:NAD(P)H dehydrogenase (quinone)